MLNLIKFPHAYFNEMLNGTKNIPFLDKTTVGNLYDFCRLIQQSQGTWQQTLVTKAG